MFNLLVKPKVVHALPDNSRMIKNYQEIRRNNPIACTSTDLQNEAKRWHLTDLAAESMFEELFKEIR